MIHVLGCGRVVGSRQGVQGSPGMMVPVHAGRGHLHATGPPVVPWLGHGHIIHLRGFTGWLLNLGEELLTHLNHGTTSPSPHGTLFSSDRRSHWEQIKLMG